MSDIEKAFTYLHDGIPQWFKNVAEIEGKIVAMQHELAKAPASRTVTKKRKSDSVESIQGLDAVPEEPGMSVAGQPSPQATQKWKTPSIPSQHASKPIKIRSRTMIVVSYDGQLQNSFEQLVRAIGTGRNMLRKGKMVAKMDAMAALAGSDDDSDDDDAVMSKIGYRHRTGLSSMRTRVAMARTGVVENSSTPVEVFDTTDKALENAQSLCEKAAHQSLREGDCRKELDIVRGHFQEVQETAKKEVARIAARKEKGAQEAEKKASEETKMETAAAPPQEPKPVEIIPTVHSPHIMSTVMDIEVDDDDDDEDMNFVMPPIRLTSRV
ncbi:hypothetical protein K458DRAFT_308097 [Lentithecium fluviatile CBS 122367]|uniref:Uncharacterized protein n=1 Tax=Lentithecium fluviatile CBS 122367 TaxID=1168545 RepID=A0A6G1IW11_9PLEO|nr:hypothetical protein K458DRAFT_308097 [Lentithecium fluviatile CBS 122367]